jgi:hypothetical protein
LAGLTGIINATLLQFFSQSIRCCPPAPNIKDKGNEVERMKEVSKIAIGSQQKDHGGVRLVDEAGIMGSSLAYRREHMLSGSDV